MVARRQRTYLDIDFERKNYAKRYGARWDDTKRLWYVLGDVPSDLAIYVKHDKSATSESKANSRTQTVLRNPPADDRQSDFFVPELYEVATKDSRSIMDVAVFRLSKKEKRAGEVLRHNLPDGYVEVSSGPAGMASIWDYDIVLMAVSHLTDAMNRFKAGKGERPSRVFRPHANEILKFCRRGSGGKQSERIEGALDRLKTTSVKIVRTTSADGRQQREVAAEGLLNSYRIVSYTDTGKASEVEIELPNWIFRVVTESKQPEVLTVHRDYFLIEPGIGRFLYRLARRAAGKTSAQWSFELVYQRSGSTGTAKKFYESLRKLIATDTLPEYSMSETLGKDGPHLVMTYRTSAINGP